MGHPRRFGSGRIGREFEGFDVKWHIPAIRKGWGEEKGKQTRGGDVLTMTTPLAQSRACVQYAIHCAAWGKPKLQRIRERANKEKRSTNLAQPEQISTSSRQNTSASAVLVVCISVQVETPQSWW